MIRTVGLLIATLGIACAPSLPPPATAGDAAALGIAVVGQGEAEARPDLARFRVGIEVRRPTVSAARDAGSEAQARVLNALREADIEAERIRTTGLSLVPDYAYREGGRELLGYRMRNQVEVEVRDLTALPRILDAAVSAGGDASRLQGIEFSLIDPRALRAEARQKAMEDARATAEQIAALAGVALGAPLSIEDVASGGSTLPVSMGLRAEASAAPPPPVEPGVTKARVQLRVRYAIR